jgi:hypothetical protein
MLKNLFSFKTILFISPIIFLWFGITASYTIDDAFYAFISQQTKFATCEQLIFPTFPIYSLFTCLSLGVYGNSFIFLNLASLLISFIQIHSYFDRDKNISKQFMVFVCLIPFTFIWHTSITAALLTISGLLKYKSDTSRFIPLLLVFLGASWRLDMAFLIFFFYSIYHLYTRNSLTLLIRPLVPFFLVTASNLYILNKFDINTSRFNDSTYINYIINSKQLSYDSILNLKLFISYFPKEFIDLNLANYAPGIRDIFSMTYLNFNLSNLGAGYAYFANPSGLYILTLIVISLYLCLTGNKTNIVLISLFLIIYLVIAIFIGRPFFFFHIYGPLILFILLLIIHESNFAAENYANNIMILFVITVVIFLLNLQINNRISNDFYKFDLKSSLSSYSSETITYWATNKYNLFSSVFSLAPTDLSKTSVSRIEFFGQLYKSDFYGEKNFLFRFINKSTSPQGALIIVDDNLVNLLKDYCGYSKNGQFQLENVENSLDLKRVYCIVE